MKTPLAEQLLEIRNILGFKSAMAFYKYLTESVDLDFNYSYYSRIEGGKVVPSYKVISVISSLIEKELGDQLVNSFCSTIFPKKQYLFKNQGYDETVIEEKDSKDLMLQFEKPQVMSKYAISIISKNKDNYYLFILGTLARENFSKQNLINYFPEDKLETSIEDLKSIKLLDEKDGIIVFSINEQRLPKADDSDIRAMYKKLDQWDVEFAEYFNMKTPIKKQFVRRVSKRYLKILESHLELVFDTIRVSDEVKVSHNEDVVCLTVQMSSGRLPG